MKNHEYALSFHKFNELLPAALALETIPVFINFEASMKALLPKCYFKKEVKKVITFEQDTMYFYYIRNATCQRKRCQPSKVANSCPCMDIFAFGPNAPMNISKCHGRLFSSQEFCMLAFGFNRVESYDKMVQLWQEVNNSSFVNLKLLQDIFTSKVLRSLTSKKLKNHEMRNPWLKTCQICANEFEQATFNMADGQHFTLCFVDPTERQKLTLAELLQLGINFSSLYSFSRFYQIAQQTTRELKAMLHGRCRFYAFGTYFGILHGIQLNTEPPHTWKDPDDVLAEHIHVESIRTVIWSFVVACVFPQKLAETSTKLSIDCVPYLQVKFPDGICKEEYKLLHIKNERGILVHSHTKGELRLDYKPWKEANIERYLKYDFAAFASCHCISLLPPLLHCVEIEWKQKNIIFSKIFLYNAVVHEFKHMWDSINRDNSSKTYDFENIFSWDVHMSQLSLEWKNINRNIRPFGYTDNNVLLPLIVKHSVLRASTKPTMACSKCIKDLMLAHFEQDANEICNAVGCLKVQGMIWKIKKGVFVWKVGMNSKQNLF